MPRIALGLEYAGTGFAGWQRQSALTTVQGVVESALGRVADHAISCTVAGRTDAGVHATAQVLHFDSDAPRTERNWRLGANNYLPHTVSVVWAQRVPTEFHARYSALSRSYRYLIVNRNSRSGLAAGRATWIHRPLDAVVMHAAAQGLVGEHDFTSFRALSCQARSPVRCIERIEVVREGDLLRVAVTANAFLQHMVRNIVGLLIAIGCGDAPVERLARVLEARDRTQNAATAPPDGLYLVGVRYPAEFSLPAPTSIPLCLS
ncbi:MAG: tRNA pseudouridine(38-40) synthase TruA [Pseudomonadales bacterium]|jgi:tRNA pseudouridine38-40 synthase|nr:tRNA pseudouridine(38-40) synthase TruA [Pseudomonadales bacterium]